MADYKGTLRDAAGEFINPRNNPAMAEPTLGDIIRAILAADGERDPDAASNLAVEETLDIVAALRRAEGEIARFKEQIAEQENWIGVLKDERMAADNIALSEEAKHARAAEKLNDELRRMVEEPSEELIDSITLDCHQDHTIVRAVFRALAHRLTAK